MEQRWVLTTHSTLKKFIGMTQIISTIKFQNITISWKGRVEFKIKSLPHLLQHRLNLRNKSKPKLSTLESVKTQIESKDTRRNMKRRRSLRGTQLRSQSMMSMLLIAMKQERQRRQRETPTTPNIRHAHAPTIRRNTGTIRSRYSTWTCLTPKQSSWGPSSLYLSL